MRPRRQARPPSPTSPPRQRPTVAYLVRRLELPRAFVDLAEERATRAAPVGGLTMAGRAAARAAAIVRGPSEYALIRVVLRAERGERFNAGVVLFCSGRSASW